MAKFSTEHLIAHEIISAWEQLKEQHPQALVFFKQQGSYLCIGEDAAKIAKTLAISPAGRGIRTRIVLEYKQMHDIYLEKMLKVGYMVLFCDTPPLSNRRINITFRKEK